MKYSNIIFFIFLLCSNSLISSKKVKEQLSLTQPQSPEKPNIFVGVEGTLNSLMIDGVELLGTQLNQQDSPIRTYNHLIQPGSKITISAINKAENKKGIAAYFKYKNLKDEPLIYSTNENEWYCNDVPAIAIGTVGSSDEYTEFNKMTEWLRGVQIIWSDNTDTVVCTVEIPITDFDKQMMEQRKAQNNILFDSNGAIYSFQVDGQELLSDEEKGRKDIALSHDIKEGDPIRIVVASNADNKAFSGRIIYYNNKDKQQIFATQQKDWLCDIEPANLIGNVGESDHVSPMNKYLTGTQAIWGKPESNEIVCETVIPKLNLPEETVQTEEKAQQQQKEKEIIKELIDNVIIGAESKLISLKVNGQVIAENVESEVVKLTVDLKEGDELEAKLSSELGKAHGFAGKFKFLDKNGEVVNMTTNDIDWTCDNDFPEIQENVGNGIYFNNWKLDLEGVDAIWGKEGGKRTTCKVKLEILKGGIIYAADPKILSVKINGVNFPIKNRDDKDYSEIRRIKANIKYGDKIEIELPKPNYFSALVIAEKDGLLVTYPMTTLDFNQEGIIATEIGKIGTGTPYDKCWKILKGAPVITVEEDIPTESTTIFCDSKIEEKKSFIHVIASGKLTGLAINQVETDLKQLGDLENPAIAKLYQGEIKYGDIISITAERGRGHVRDDFIAAKIYLYIAPGKYDVIYTNNYLWECNDVQKPTAYGEITKDVEYHQWRKYDLGATKIWGSQNSHTVKCSTTLFKPIGHVFLAGKGGLKEFYVNDKLIDTITDSFSENPDEVKEFEHDFKLGDNVTIVMNKKDASSGLVGKITIPFENQNAIFETNEEEWICNDKTPKVVGTVGKEEQYDEYKDDFSDVKVISADDDLDTLTCKITLKKYKSKIKFSAKDNIKALLINGEPVNLEINKNNKSYKKAKEVEVMLKLGDEVRILAQANEKENDWNGIIGVISYKPASEYAKTILTDAEHWECGIGETKVIDNSDTIKYWDNEYLGAKAIWEDEPRFTHRVLGCKTVIQ